MNFQNTVLAATVGLLTCSDQCFGEALARCDGLFNSNVPYSTDKPSVAVRSVVGVTPLREWLTRSRAGGLLSCEPGFDGQENGNIAAHMVAGFLGGRPSKLHVCHAGTRVTYNVGTVSSAVYAMTVIQFAELINAQAEPEFYWQKILTDINQFHVCNGVVEVERDELGEFLESDAGAQAWNFNGKQIMREVQVEALTFGKPFLIPAHLANLVKKVVPIHDMFPYVWLDAYNEEEVTGAHLYQLVMAQQFHAEIWRQCADPRQLEVTLGDAFDLTTFPHIDAGHWGQYLQGLDAIDAGIVRDEVLKLVQLECEQRGCEPLIPAALEDIFGPNEEERRRLSFRARLQHDMGWYLKPHPAPWRMFVFDEERREACAKDTNGAFIKDDHRQRFETALRAIAAFAAKVKSPFVAHFQLAKVLAAAARADDPFDRASFEQICKSNNVPDYLVSTELVDLFAAFGWRTTRVFGLAAVAAADVFGAMGSWNDQSFDGDEAIQFDAVSSQLFSTMNGYLASLLTVERR